MAYNSDLLNIGYKPTAGIALQLSKSPLLGYVGKAMRALKPLGQEPPTVFASDVNI